MACAEDVAVERFFIAAVVTGSTGIGTGDGHRGVKGVEVGGSTLRVTGDTAGIALRQNVTNVEDKVHAAFAGQTADTGGRGVGLDTGINVGTIPNVINVAGIAFGQDTGGEYLGATHICGSGILYGTVFDTNVLDGSAVGITDQTNIFIGRSCGNLDLQVLKDEVMAIQGALKGGIIGNVHGSHVLMAHIHIVEQMDGDAGEALTVGIGHSCDLGPIVVGGYAVVLAVVELGIKSSFGRLGIIGIDVLQNGSNRGLISNQRGGCIDGLLDHSRSLLLLLKGKNGLGIIDDLLQILSIGKEVHVIFFVMSQNIGGYVVVRGGLHVTQGNVCRRHGKAFGRAACGDARLVETIIGDGLDGNGLAGEVIRIFGVGHRAVGEPLFNGYLADGGVCGSKLHVAIGIKAVQRRHIGGVGQPIEGGTAGNVLLGSQRLEVLGLMVGRTVAGSVQHIHVGYVAGIVFPGGKLTNGTHDSCFAVGLGNGSLTPAILDRNVIAPGSGHDRTIIIVVDDPAGAQQITGRKAVLDDGSAVHTLDHQGGINIVRIEGGRIVIIRLCVYHTEILDHGTCACVGNQTGADIGTEAETGGLPVLDHMVLTVEGGHKIMGHAQRHCRIQVGVGSTLGQIHIGTQLDLGDLIGGQGGGSGQRTEEINVIGGRQGDGSNQIGAAGIGVLLQVGEEGRRGLPGLGAVDVGVVLGVTLGNDGTVLTVGQHRVADAFYVFKSNGVALDGAFGGKAFVQLGSQGTVGQCGGFQTDRSIVGTVQGRLGAGDHGSTALNQFIGGLGKATILDVVVIGAVLASIGIQRLTNHGGIDMALGTGGGISIHAGNDLTGIVAGDYFIAGTVDPAVNTGRLGGAAVDQA